MYRIYFEINAADTWRDPDDISTTELGYAETKEEAIQFMQKYIDEKFFQSKLCESIVREHRDTLQAVEYCSYGRKLIAKPMKKVSEYEH